MRSKEVDLAIKNFENYDKLISIYRPKDVTIENPQDFNKDVETVLNYISELEKDNKRYEKELHGVLKYSIAKHVIRDKIKELEETKGDFATYIATSERIQVLKEIIGE